MLFAQPLELVVDQILGTDPDARIVVAGDFNAEPDEVAVLTIRGDIERPETSCSAPTSSWRWPGSWLATAGSPATPTRLTFASTWPGAPNIAWRCSGRVAPTSNVSPATSSPWAGPGPPSRDGCARWHASTATPNRKALSPSRRRPTCGVRGWTTSPMPPASLATRS